MLQSVKVRNYAVVVVVLDAVTITVQIKSYSCGFYCSSNCTKVFGLETVAAVVVVLDVVTPTVVAVVVDAF